MKRFWVFAGIVVMLSGSVCAEPMSDTERPANAASNGGVWGDPEERQRGDTDWTWFGMGYERRSGGTAAAPALGSGGADAGAAAATARQNQNGRR